MSERNVVVVMPFGGTDRIESRRAVLNFKRIEYLITKKCAVTSVSPSERSKPVIYNVDLARTAMGDISDIALKQIESADIVIALMVQPNANVIYEVAHRKALDRTVVLVVDSNTNLPLYLNGLAYQNWKQGEVVDRITQIANDSFPKLPDFGVEIPDALREAIDQNDSALQQGLEKALKEIEAKFDRPPPPHIQHLRGVVAHNSIINSYPSSIVEVSISGDPKADLETPAVVRDFDDGFSRLYGYTDKREALADGPLNLARLLGRIQEFLDVSLWEEFKKEQMKLSAAIKARRFARAKVPLRINDMHPHGDYCGKSYLPCIVAYATDGDRNGPHKMYLLVVYIEISTPYDATPAYFPTRPEYRVTGEECHA